MIQPKKVLLDWNILQHMNHETNLIGHKSSTTTADAPPPPLHTPAAP